MTRTIHPPTPAKPFVGLVLGLGIWLCIACQPEKRHTAELVPAFYHWKTTFSPTAADRAALRAIGATTVYIRFFDVDWDAGRNVPVPKATVSFRQRPDSAWRVVPVVYITNRTVANLTAASGPDLARNLTQRIGQMARQAGIRPDEIQIDCDWNRTTRFAYFALLQAIGRQAGLPLSATIRLHQVKFAAQTGVPPVARGMLMAYNTGDWKLAATANSILDLNELQAYTGHLPGYPLPLDVALPFFRWTVVYRNGRFLTLLNNVTAGQLRPIPALQQQPDTNRYVATRDTNVLGINLRRGDLLRAEHCSLTNLKAASQLLLTQLPDQKRTFTGYHLDSVVLQPYPHDDLKMLFHYP